MLFLNNGIRLPLRRLRRMEFHFGGRVRRTPAELCRRLPGVLQAKRPSYRIRQLVARVSHQRRTGVNEQTQNSSRHSPRFLTRTIVSFSANACPRGLTERNAPMATGY